MRAKVGKMQRAPTQEEMAAHMVNHIQFRSWCSHCVKGKANGNPHREWTASTSNVNQRCNNGEDMKNKS